MPGPCMLEWATITQRIQGLTKVKVRMSSQNILRPATHFCSTLYSFNSHTCERAHAHAQSWDMMNQIDRLTAARC